MFTLLKGFPDQVVVADRALSIECGWRSHIMLETLDLSEHKAQIQALYLMYGDSLEIGNFVAQNASDALYSALEFHVAAYDYLNYGKSTVKAKPSKHRLFDWEDDQTLLLADFQSIYGIDLMRWDGHWYHFSQLFRALMYNEKALLHEAMRARSPISGKLKGEERKQALARQNAWRLPLTQEEINAELLQRFEG